VSLPVEFPILTPAGRPRARIQLVRFSYRRAFVPGQLVPLEGTAPEGCRPTLVVDGNEVRPVEPDDDGNFAIDVDTSELTPGYHVARVDCTDGQGVVESSFFVATPQSSSSTVAVVLVALMALVALGWVGIRGLIAGTGRV
jgi:hypothetical protein